jgi:LuxR family maltose regulon positive regulatory protein
VWLLVGFGLALFRELFMFGHVSMRILTGTQHNVLCAIVEPLEHALTLAHPGGLIRPFVELGPTMAGLLEQLHRDGVATDYVERILAALQTEDEGRRTQGADPSLVLRPSTVLIEPLTNRELEVLELMAQRMTNKEIAAQLVLSVGTVKQHAYNINQKLHVRGRRLAVAKAISLGILARS